MAHTRGVRFILLIVAVFTIVALTIAPRFTAPVAASDECPAGWVALTYDDGPVGGRSEAVLNALALTGTHATFFAVGKRVARWPEVALEIARAGHTIGNHTWAHEDMRTLSDAEIRSSVLRTDVALRAIGLHPVRLVRPPFLGAGKRVADALYQSVFLVEGESLNPKDWQSDVSASQVADRVVEGAKDGSVIGLHDGHKFYDKTAEATVEIVDRLTAAGFCFGVLDPHGNIVPPPADGPAYRVPDDVHVDEMLWIDYLMGRFA
jgi:peptidoglycan/xylan/chitin deacetylase (PgdA/CDA1 family)